jgi:hypothetical protein
VRKDIRDFAKKLEISKLSELSKLADLQALLIAKLAIENSDTKFKKVLAEDPELFCSIVKEELCG